MSLFNFFKKSPKKETAKIQVKPSNMDDAFFSPEMQKKRYDAAMEFIKNFQERMPLLNGKPHAGTILSVAARLAGTSLYRSLNYKNNAAPGVVVLSNEVNEAWPQLMNLFAYFCKQNGIDVTAKPVVTAFPEKDKPLMDVDQVLQEYQYQYHEIMKKHGLDYLNGARAGMVVSSIIFQYHCVTAKDIDPYIANGIVAMGVVEGAKTTPPPLGSKGSQNNLTHEKDHKNTGNIPKHNKNRLVLGEQDAAIQEALDYGGIFIDPGPQVLKGLQQSNIDPYLIYEQALKIQIEAKIQRIDFVKADVDELLLKWSGKSQIEAPIHVRLAQWLKDNAKTYGYEQIGNSWVLK